MYATRDVFGERNKNATALMGGRLAASYPGSSQRKEMSMPNEMSIPTEMMSPKSRAGHLYMQTNEVKTVIVYYHRSASGALTEVERIATGGAGSGEYKPINNQIARRMLSRGPGSVILSADSAFPICDQRRRQFSLQHAAREAASLREWKSTLLVASGARGPSAAGFYLAGQRRSSGASAR